MNSKTLRKLVLALLFAVLVYGAYAVYSDLGKMRAVLHAFQAESFFFACALAFGNYLFRYAKWEYYLRVLGIRHVPKVDSFLLFLSGFVLTITPGKVGEVFKSFLLEKVSNVPVSRSAPIVVAERVTDLIGVILLIAVGSAGFSGGLFWAGLGSLAVLVLLAVVASRRLSMFVIGVVGKLPGPFVKMAPKLEEAYASLAELVSLRNLVIPTLLSIVAWALECFALWVIVRGFGGDAGVSLCAFFYATATLAGALVPVPGGLGVTESLLQGQLVELGHVPVPVATASMMLVRIATLWFAVLVGFVALTALRKRHPTLLLSDEAEVKAGAGAREPA